MLVLAMEFSRDRNSPAARAGPDRTEVAGVAASPPEVSRAAPPDNGTEVGPTHPPVTERPEPAIGGVSGGAQASDRLGCASGPPPGRVAGRWHSLERR